MLRAVGRQLRALGIVVFGGGALLAAAIGVGVLGYHQLQRYGDKLAVTVSTTSSTALRAAPAAAAAGTLELRIDDITRANGQVILSGEARNPTGRVPNTVTITAGPTDLEGKLLAKGETRLVTVVPGQSVQWQVSVPDQGWPEIAGHVHAAWTWR